MIGKKPLGKRLLRLSLWVIGLVVVAFGIQIALLAFPQLVMSNRVQAGSVVVHYDGEADPAVQRLAEATDQRLRAGGFGNPEEPKRIFLFRDRARYSLITRLGSVPAEVQGFGISILRTVYVSAPRVEALGERTGRGPEYSVWEGSIPHTMAHEAAHLIMVDSIGRSAWSALPRWKREGFPEYVANIGLIREDSAASLPRRIDILLDDDAWLDTRSWDRIHFEAGLLMEFLLDVRGFDLHAVTPDSVTRDETYAAMLEWRRGR